MIRRRMNYVHLHCSSVLYPTTVNHPRGGGRVSSSSFPLQFILISLRPFRCFLIANNLDLVEESAGLALNPH